MFYARNTFAFEDGSTFTAFFQNLDPRWRNRITRVSLMAYYPSIWEPNASAEDEDYEWEGGKRLAKVWSLLRRLPSLSYLELDATFLTRMSEVRAMLKLGMRNLRQVCFTLRNPLSSYSTLKGNPCVRPEYHKPILLVGGLAEEVARAIKGQRRRWMKRSGALREQAVPVERLITQPITEHPGETGIFSCDDLEDWKAMWWGAGPTPSYLPASRYLDREAHWRQWTRVAVAHPDHEAKKTASSAAWEKVVGLQEVDFDVLTYEVVFGLDIYRL